MISRIVPAKTTESEKLAIAAQVIYSEALHLDRKDWDAWLDLYADPLELWAPAWRDEYETTDDPNTEVSLIYHASRLGLEERVKRVRSRKSITALPLPRTTHVVSNLLLAEAVPGEGTAEEVRTTASWIVHVYEVRTARQTVNFGLYEHTLRRDAGDQWRIARKKITLMNDRVPTVLDFYSM